ncbi:MAG: cache domain-containing protein [Acidobacteriota bacterium]
MLRRISIAARLLGLVGLVVLFCAVALFFVEAIASRLEVLVVQHTQSVMLQGEKSRIKTAAHTMALALAKAMTYTRTPEEQKELARSLVEMIRFEEDGSGYYFVYTGTTNIALPPRPDLVGQDLNDFRDQNGVYYVRDLSEQAHAGGGYVFYAFPKPSGQLERKLSYAEMIPGTDMWVGTGVYIDKVAREEAAVAAMIADLFNRAFAGSTAVFAVMLAVLFLACLVIARSVARPLAEATGAAERIAAGDLSVRLDDSGSDEASRLQASLNRMTVVLRQNIQEIKARRDEAEEKAQLAGEALKEARRAGQEVVAQVALRIESLQKIASAVAHQLRNPTTIIGGLAGLLVKKPSMRQSYLEYLDGIIEAARRIENITTAVKEYSNLHLGRLEMTQVENMLRAGVQAGEAHALILGKTPVWEVEAGSDNMQVFADPKLLRLALRELVANAVEALPAQGGVIRLAARRHPGQDGGGAMEIAVTDTGRGIPEGELQYVLDPFYSTKPVGVGMGLTKANRIVQEHGGSITVESAEGKGTTVRLLLPEQAPDIAAVMRGKI